MSQHLLDNDSICEKRAIKFERGSQCEMFVTYIVNETDQRYYSHIKHKGIQNPRPSYHPTWYIKMLG